MRESSNIGKNLPKQNQFLDTLFTQQNLDFELLGKHFLNAKETGELSLERMSNSREILMQDVDENYAIMMEFHRELAKAFTKIMEQPPPS